MQLKHQRGPAHDHSKLPVGIRDRQSYGKKSNMFKIHQSPIMIAIHTNTRSVMNDNHVY